ncbi:MAG: SAM-dependent methyltransferase [Planctomycetota bacterium]|jgi:hypothetical protein
MEHLRRVTSSILESQSPAYSLRPEVVEMTTILADSQTMRIAQQEDISRGETRTSNGLALSPTMAAMCADDFVRTIKFIRGTHAAIVGIRKLFPHRPVRVLYVGCGPYATLVIPLMTVFSSTEATFTLLDLHPESIQSAESIVDTLGLTDSVASFETVDAGSYRVCPDQPPDVILMEIMRACLESEPQVPVTRHLLEQAPHAILVPEEVTIDLTLVDPSREFDLDGLEQNRGPVQRDRIPVASVFVVNRQSVSSWDNCSDRLPASSARIPEPLEQRYEPMLFTTIRVYKNHVLKDYDSGLTYPRPLSIQGEIKPGDTIRFHYKLGSHPRLNGEVCARSD